MLDVDAERSRYERQDLRDALVDVLSQLSPSSGVVTIREQAPGEMLRAVERAEAVLLTTNDEAMLSLGCRCGERTTWFADEDMAQVLTVRGWVADESGRARCCRCGAKGEGETR